MFKSTILVIAATRLFTRCDALWSHSKQCHTTKRTNSYK